MNQIYFVIDGGILKTTQVEITVVQGLLYHENHLDWVQSMECCEQFYLGLCLRDPGNVGHSKRGEIRLRR